MVQLALTPNEALRLAAYLRGGTEFEGEHHHAGEEPLRIPPILARKVATALEKAAECVNSSQEEECTRITVRINPLRILIFTTLPLVITGVLLPDAMSGLAILIRNVGVSNTH